MVEEEIINKIKINKRRLNRIYKYVTQYIDLKNRIEDSETLSVLTAIAKIDEDLLHIIYMLRDNEKTKKI